MEQQTFSLVPQDNTAIYLLTKAEIDTQISTAKAFPRSIAEFMKKAESMATISEDIAASCCYALPRGGKAIEGPSIRLAEIIVACYGNVRASARIISNDGRTITAQGTCHDLENNVAAQVEVKRRITDRYNKTLSEDMQVIIGNAACAIAYRNAVYKVIPAALINPIFEQTKNVARGTAATLTTRRNAALDYFRSLGVKDVQICTVLEIKKVEDIDLDKLQVLTGMKSAIKNGESTVKDLFEAEQEIITLEQIKALYEQKKGQLKPEDIEAAERIINNNEEKSFNKLHKALKAI